VLSHWFHDRRALASGFVMAGSSFGGAVIPLMLRSLFPRYGWKWSIRVIAFMALGFFIIGFNFVKGRLPRDKTPRATIDFKVFKTARLCFLAVAVFAFEFIISGCVALLPTYVRYAGFPEDTQFYSLTTFNACSLVGRPLPGLAADRFGRFNMLTILVVVTLITMVAVWLPFGSSSEAALYTVVALFGLGSGGWLSLAPVCAGQLCRTEDYGRFYGTIYMVASFGALVTVPIGGELIQFTTPRGLVGFYSAMLCVGLASIVASRWALLEWKWKWKVKV